MRRVIDIDEMGIINYSEIIEGITMFEYIVEPGFDSRKIPGQLRHIVDAIHTPYIVNTYLDFKKSEKT